MRDVRHYLQREPKDLRSRELAGRRMVRKYLFDADLRGVDASGAVFDASILEGARFDGSTLRGTSFLHAHLAHAKMRDCDLTGAVLGHERRSARPDHTCHYAQFHRSTLDGADLSRARLTYAAFDDASLRDVNLDRAVAIAGQLQRADLRGASLAFADLSRARLEGADLRGANLRFTNLSGANLEGALVDDTTVWRGTRYDHRTRWFDGERRRAPI